MFSPNAWQTSLKCGNIIKYVFLSTYQKYVNYLYRNGDFVKVENGIKS